jgi:hypothetical protein
MREWYPLPAGVNLFNPHFIPNKLPNGRWANVEYIQDSKVWDIAIGDDTYTNSRRW